MAFKRNKFGSVREEYNGRTYHSKKEARYSMLLDNLRSAVNLNERVISVQYQVPFVFQLKGKKIFTYLLDFLIVYGDDRVVHVDVKGYRDGIYILKKKIIESEFDITIVEV